MADTIASSGTYTVSINGSTSKYVGDLSLTTLTKTGSNATADVKNITSASAWTPLNTSSLSDMRYMYFSNESTSSIIVASDSAGTKILTVLQPGDSSLIASSGSIATQTLYANVPASTSSSVLYYIVSES